MSSWCQQLKQALIDNSKWKATILFKSLYASAINNIMIDNLIDSASRDIKISSSQYYDFDTTVNIVNLLNPQNFALISKLKTIATQHSYPNTAMFHFENYDVFGNKV